MYISVRFHKLCAHVMLRNRILEMQRRPSRNTICQIHICPFRQLSWSKEYIVPPIKIKCQSKSQLYLMSITIFCLKLTFKQLLSQFRFIRNLLRNIISFFVNSVCIITSSISKSIFTNNNKIHNNRWKTFLTFYYV